MRLTGQRKHHITLRASCRSGAQSYDVSTSVLPVGVSRGNFGTIVMMTTVKPLVSWNAALKVHWQAAVLE